MAPPPSSATALSGCSRTPSAAHASTRTKAKGRKARDGCPAPACHVCCRIVLWLVNSRPLLRDPAALGRPVLGENRPQRLIQVLAVLQEGLAKDAFLHCADLAERAVAAPVADRGPRLEAMHTDLFERETDQHLGAFLEH